MQLHLQQGGDLIFSVQLVPYFGGGGVTLPLMGHSQAERAQEALSATSGHAHKTTHSPAGAGIYISVALMGVHRSPLPVPKSNGVALGTCTIKTGLYAGVPQTYADTQRSVGSPP